MHLVCRLEAAAIKPGEPGHVLGQCDECHHACAVDTRNCRLADLLGGDGDHHVCRECLPAYVDAP